MKNINAFTGLSDTYEKGRPGYAKEFICDLSNIFNISKDYVIADIGAGTGKFSKMLLDAGYTVYCVEPNNDMYNKGKVTLKEYENCHYLEGSASNTLLEDHSIDVITCAQSFHWFNTDEFIQESKRILKHDGTVFLIWNMRDDSLSNQLCYQIFKKYCPRFKGFGGGILKDDERIQKYFHHYTRYSYPNPIYLNEEMFMARSLSGSYTLHDEDEHYDEYIQELHDVFVKCAKDGILVQGNNTVVYAGKI